MARIGVAMLFDPLVQVALTCEMPLALFVCGLDNSLR